MENQNPPDEEQHDDEQDLTLENELLKIKLQAETGAQVHSSADVPPEIENMLLQNIRQFHDAWQNPKMVKVYEHLGEPAFTPIDALEPEQIPVELQRLRQIMQEHAMDLDINDEYPPEVLYRFITEELFRHETPGIYIPGMTTHFIYEEFHPNPKLIIRQRTEAFLKNWFKMDSDEIGQLLVGSIILANDAEFTDEGTKQKLRQFFDCFRRFSDTAYQVDNIVFQWSGSIGSGHVEGTISYIAELENREDVTFSGPFKLLFSNEYNSWDIFYFVIPGFAW